MKKKTQSKTATTPAAAPDPMKLDLSKVSIEQEEQVHDAILAQLLQRLAAKPTHRLQAVLWYVEILETDSGCDTPAEEFITRLVMVHASSGLTPDDVARDLEQFRLNFDDMALASAAFSARYPEAVKLAATA